MKADRGLRSAGPGETEKRIHVDMRRVDAAPLPDLAPLVHDEALHFVRGVLGRAATLWRLESAWGLLQNPVAAPLEAAVIGACVAKQPSHCSRFVTTAFGARVLRCGSWSATSAIVTWQAPGTCPRQCRSFRLGWTVLQLPKYRKNWRHRAERD